MCASDIDSNVTAQSNFKPKTDSVILLDRKRSQLVTVPLASIVHMPAKFAKGNPVKENSAKKYPEICEKFHPWGSQSCINKDSCEFVHAHLASCARKTVHFSWAWRSLEECQYERYPAGKTIPVREPISAKSDIIDHVDSGYILKTRCVFDDPNRPPTHCAHFYYSRECHIGQRCDFAHVLHVNPFAQTLERAPPPISFGRTRCTSAGSPPTPTCSVPKIEKKLLPTGVSPTTHCNMVSFPGSHQSLDSLAGTPSASPSVPYLSLSPLPAEFSSSSTTVLRARCRKTPLSATPVIAEVVIHRNPCYHELLSAEPPCCSSPPVGASRWRHDPYSTSSAKAVAPLTKAEQRAALLKEEQNETGFFSPSWFSYFNHASDASSHNGVLPALQTVSS